MARSRTRPLNLWFGSRFPYFILARIVKTYVRNRKAAVGLALIGGSV